MKLKSLIAGVFVMLAISGISVGKASAEELAFPLSQKETSVFDVRTHGILKTQETKLTLETKQEEKKTEPAPPTVVEYTVVEADSLAKIAKAHNVEWKRLWDKNLNVQHPDMIYPGNKLIIPVVSETLPDRALPAPPVQVAEVATVTATPKAQSAPVVPRGASSGNTYTAGYCTWYVKNRRPDLPNNLGNANTWFHRARAQGMAVGYTPRAGAAAQTKAGMHVVYVESVNGNGTVNISEMNYRGLYQISSRTVPASDLLYIY